MRCNLAPSLGLRLLDVPEGATDGQGGSPSMSPRERVRRALRRRGTLTMEGIAAATGMSVEDVRPVVYALVAERQVQRDQTFTLLREPAR